LSTANARITSRVSADADQRQVFQLHVVLCGDHRQLGDVLSLAGGLAGGCGLDDGLVDELGKEFLIGFGETTTPRAYRVRQTGATVQPNDHCALRWMTADELGDLAWVPADRAWLPHLSRERSDRR
jgi:hypothetical protein